MKIFRVKREDFGGDVTLLKDRKYCVEPEHPNGGANHKRPYSIAGVYNLMRTPKVHLEFATLAEARDMMSYVWHRKQGRRQDE